MSKKIVVKSFVNTIKSKEYYLDYSDDNKLIDIFNNILRLINLDNTDSSNNTKKYELVLCYNKSVSNNNDNLDIKYDNIDINSNNSIGNLKSKIIMKNSSLNSEIFDKNSYFIIRPNNLNKILSMKLGVTIAYGGPILILLYYYLNLSNPILVQKIALLLSVFHYIKRTYESNYVNYYEGLFNIPSLIGLVFYYWILFAIIVSRGLFNEEYSLDKQNINRSVVTIVLFTIGMIYSEVNNFRCHKILSNLKKQNNGKRGIPYGNLFDYVSCPHYFWELCSWICFFIIVRTLSSFLFVIYSFISMFLLALDKHKEYIRHFGSKYPYRKVMIPKII